MDKEIEIKDKLIIGFLESEDLDGILLRRRDSFSWATGGKVNHIIHTTEDGFVDLLFTRHNKYCIANTVERYRIMEEELVGLGFELVTYDWWISRVEQIVKKIIGQGKLGCDSNFSKAVNVETEFRRLRFSLCPEEIARFRELSFSCAKAVEDTCREILPGQTELSVCAELVHKVMRNGIEPMVALVASDDRIFKYRHPLPKDKVINKYAMVVICGRKYGLVSNLTRFVHFGRVDEEILEKREKVLKVEAEMIECTKVGNSISNIMQSCIGAYEKVGFKDEWHKLHQGGAAGYLTREYLAVPEMQERVHLNQAFTWNPSITGTKIEDTFLVTEKGPEILTETNDWPQDISVSFNGAGIKRTGLLVL